jgi:hypothetical protein
MSIAHPAQEAMSIIRQNVSQFIDKLFSLCYTRLAGATNTHYAFTHIVF